MDEDELLFKPFYVPFTPSVAPSFVTVGSITSNISPVQPPDRARSKLEAIDRASSRLAGINRAFRGIPFFRPYVLGLNVLTYGLILVDPLDRLE